MHLRKKLEGYRFDNGTILLYMDNHACVPDNIQLVVLCMNHDSPVCRHWIQPKTCESISQHYTWTSMGKYANKYIIDYLGCVRLISIRQELYSHILPLAIPVTLIQIVVDVDLNGVFHIMPKINQC